MNEPLFEIENWRGGWYYKLGSRYTGPYTRRDSAVTAARVEIDPLLAPTSKSLRATLAGRQSLDPVDRDLAVEDRERILVFGMRFRMPGAGAGA
ncbi:hypothetical protein PZ897_00765 [Hoeflea sp. YIM 152468]|uniref:hypothetical protein n=1 Tax=Hoeflea sp. YIM 152468 TaxID=3031759 RepID=UPI0023DB8C03|nr:hypothetical protein [Hoeflea sp. YIM 152468]MDF1606698.1 hypothetical protein [Hoeflea sp. YIM 152468]